MRIKSEYIRNIAKLTAGNTFATVISFSISPLLTRLYSKESFGLLALYISIATVLSVVSTGRFEHAVVIAEKQKFADAAVLLCLSILVITTIVVALPIFLFREMVEEAFNFSIGYWLHLIPLAVFLLGFYRLVNSMLVRRKAFTVIARTKVVQNSVQETVNVVLALFSKLLGGLIVGYMLGFISTLILQLRNLKNDFANLQRVSIADMRDVALRYKKLPLYDIPSAFVSTLSAQLPVLFLSGFYTKDITGAYSITQKSLGAPIQLLGSSVLQVFKQRANNDYLAKGNCRTAYRETFKTLFLSALFPIVLLLLFGPWLFGFVFGDEWRVSGVYAQILGGMFFLKLIVSPLSYVFYIAEKQKENLLLQLSVLILGGGGLYLGDFFFSKPEYSLFFFSAAYSLVYLIYLYRSYKLALGKSK